MAVDHIKKDHSKPLVRLASCLPSWQAMLSVLRCWENSFEKTRTSFGRSGSRNIRKQITFFLTPPILKKIEMKMGCFPDGYTSQKQGKVITYPILSGLHHHYVKLLVKLSYLILPYFIISIAKPSHIHMVQ